MTSVRFSPRNCLAELSPITQRTASIMLDLPQPFGPTTAQRLPGRVTVVASTKDLKPANLICFSLIDSLQKNTLGNSDRHSRQLYLRLRMSNSLLARSLIDPSALGNSFIVLAWPKPTKGQALSSAAVSLVTPSRFADLVGSKQQSAIPNLLDLPAQCLAC